MPPMTRASALSTSASGKSATTKSWPDAAARSKRGRRTMTARHDAVADAIDSAIRAEVPGLPEARRDLSWQALGLDSFGLVALRAAAEQALGRDIPTRNGCPRRPRRT